jgi:hypothetical protein
MWLRVGVGALCVFPSWRFRETLFGDHASDSIVMGWWWRWWMLWAFEQVGGQFSQRGEGDSDIFMEGEVVHRVLGVEMLVSNPVRNSLTA